MASKSHNGKASEHQAVSIETEAGVAIVTLDVPGESVNTLGPELSKGLGDVLIRIESSPDISCAVIISGKDEGFIAGADIRLLSEVSSATEGEMLSRQAQLQLQALADCKKPVVAAIHGACLGGGLELALACHGRVASRHRKTRLGLPEVQLGLLPGAGGTQRLPRLIGLQAALDLILTGKQVDARKAAKLGLVDEVVPPALLRRAASELALSLVEHAEREGSALGKVTDAFRHLFSTDDLQELVLEENPLGRKVLFDQARKRLLAKTRGNYPAPERALEVIRTGMNEGMKEGLAAESRAFGDLLVTSESRELVGIFNATQALKKDPGVDAKVQPEEVARVGVLGAGLMGSGVAYVTAANAQLPVRLKDRKPEDLARGLSSIHEIVARRVERRRISERDGSLVMEYVSPTTDYSGFERCDVIIEAVFEDLELKQTIVRELEEHGAGEVIFASNTSTIPISRIAEASKHPELVIGMHYFSPVHKMPLLEVITTEATAPEVVATCVALGKTQGKTVIVVRDGAGFYTSRILGPYIGEAAHLLSEGVRIEDIDEALVNFGFPVGPVKLLDEVGIDVAQKAGKVVRAAFGDRLDPPPGLDALVADGRLGRKAGRGFYRYGDKKKGVDESVYQILGVRPTGHLDEDDIAMRCTLTMVNEAAHCFGEGILRSARDGDIGAVFGLGFPPFRGGPFRFVDSLGAERVVSLLDGYRDRLGARFEAAPVLRKLAQKGGSFYPTEDTRPVRPGKYTPEKSGVPATA